MSILTAEEFEEQTCEKYDSYSQMMVEFTKLHLKAQKEAIIYAIENWMPEIDARAMDKVDNAYDLDNIK